MALRKTVIKIELLWDDEITNNPANMELKEIDYEITDGSISGVTKVMSDKTLTKKEMKHALIAQGSDPEFLIG